MPAAVVREPRQQRSKASPTCMPDAEKVTVQFDNAGGHGMSSIMGKIDDVLPAPAGGGPELNIIQQ